MKLDVNVLRYLSKEDFRVLTAIEMGQKNHELVPMPLIDSIAGLKHGGAFQCIKTLMRHKLVHHENVKYDGYRLTYMGYDFLAIKTLVNRGHITGVGRQIGVGKESDIFEVMNEDGEVLALKMHRLGRTSFRAVKSKRDYLGRRQNFSWLYLSRLAALKEYAFMRALGDHGFPVPQAVDNNRHAVLMTMMDARPLVQLRELDDPAPVYLAAMDLIGRLAAKGLIHCDFNEFNLLINEQEELTLIDFPQMVSVSHANAKELFERDVECVLRFFNKKIGYMPQQDNSLPYVRPVFEEVAAAAADGLDVELAASGFQRQHQQVLEDFAAAEAGSGDEDEEEGGSEEGSGGEEEEEGSAGEEQEEEGEEEDGQQRGGSRAAAQRSRLAGLSLRDSSGQQQAEGSGAESGGEDEASGSEEGEEGSGEEGDEEQRSSRRGSSRQQAAAAPATADRLLVQQRLNQQVKRAGKQAAFAKASRNATKPKTKKSKAAAAAMTGW